MFVKNNDENNVNFEYFVGICVFVPSTLPPPPFTLLLDKPIAETETKLKRFRSHSIYGSVEVCGKIGVERERVKCRCLRSQKNLNCCFFATQITWMIEKKKKKKNQLRARTERWKTEWGMVICFNIIYSLSPSGTCQLRCCLRMSCENRLN